MKKQMIYGLALALAAPLGAQGFLYSPKDLDSKTEGTYYCYYFGGFSNARQQYADGENSGKAAVIAAFNVRLDYRSHTSTTAPGRKWTNVMMSIGEGSVSGFSTTFSSNFTTTPQVVFNAAWSLPAVTGYPTTSPSIYGGLKGEYRVPFSTSFVYTGKGDIVHDWQFMGGTLDNNVTWTTSSVRTYYFDSYSSASEFSNVGSTYAYIPTTRLNNTSTGVTTRCNDSEHGSTTTGAYCLLYAYAYGPKYPIDNYRGRLYFYHVSYYTGYENPVIHGLAFANDTTGLDLGTGCNKLHLKGPMLLFPRVTMPSTYSSSGYSGYQFRLVPWIAAMSGLQVTVQAAWADSSTNRFALSQGRQATLPSGLPGPAPQRIHTYQYQSPTATTGFGPYNYYYMNPATAWETK